MGRQTQLHALPKDLNELLIAMHAKEALEVALRTGSTAHPERLGFVPDNMRAQILVVWSERFVPNLQRRFVARAGSPYYIADEQKESVFELSLSGVTTWQRQTRSYTWSHLRSFSKQAARI